MKPAKYRIAPSLLAADLACLAKEIDAITHAGADWIHLDVMDNHYVPNLTFGPLICAAVRRHTQLLIDVHLMAKPVDALIVEFARAGANLISFHPEASEHIDRSIRLIHEYGCKAGLAFNPATPLYLLDHVMDEIDMVLIMSVNPGFGGQAFLPGALKKINETRQRIDCEDREIFLAVDGGIKIDNIAKVAQAGADTFIAGSAIFGQADYAQTITQMRNMLAQ